LRALSVAPHRPAYYVHAMIRSWRNSVTRKVWEGARPNEFRGLDFESAVDLLLALNVAKALNDQSPLR
jgi:toxin HigB-1